MTPGRSTPRRRSRRPAATRRSSIATLVAVVLLAVVAAPTLATGVGAADSSAAPAVVEQRGTVERTASIDGVLQLIDEAVPFTGEGISLDDLLGVLLAGVLLSGLLDRVSAASWFDFGVKSRLFRSIAAVAPGRRSTGQKRTEGADADDVRSDEEVVRRLLERHDGRMRQSKIVEETEWSKAKVSRLLGKMEDAGEIVKVPIGRQNLVYLDGKEPEITKPHGEAGG